LEAVSDPVAAALAVGSREELVAYLVDLAQRARAGRTPVENVTSVDMIEAAAYWTEGMEEFLLARGQTLSGLSTWSIVAMTFSAGLVYE
jgi:hypothetical protein